MKLTCLRTLVLEKNLTFPTLPSFPYSLPLPSCTTHFHLSGTHISQSVQSLSLVQLFATSCTAACQASLSITNSQSLLKLMSINSGMTYNHLILCHPLLVPSVVPFSSCLQSFPASGSFPMSQFFCIRWPKYWASASAPVLPMNIQDYFL